MIRPRFFEKAALAGQKELPTKDRITDAQHLSLMKPVPPKPQSTSPGVGLHETVLAAEAMSTLLRPLARLMIDHGLHLPATVELLKSALVEEAQSAYALEQKASTDTRIAILTGVHRKDVRRLRNAPSVAKAPDTMLPLAASVVARWISDPRYLDADQQPRPLARTPGRSSAGVPDFTALAADVSRDVGARALLDELERLGVVEKREDGFVALRSSEFVPRDGRDESFYFLAANLSDHMAASVHNLKPGQSAPLMLEQSAFSKDLSAAQADTLHALARRLWTKSLQQFLQAASLAQQRSKDEAGPRHQVRFGVFFNDAQQEAEQDAEPAPAPAPANPTTAPAKKGRA